MPTWFVNVVMPGWNDLCIGFDILKSTVSTSFNGQLGEVAEVEWVGDQVKKMLAGSRITVDKVDLLSDFNIFSLPLNKIVPGQAGNLLAWNINHWAWDERAYNTTIVKADGGIRYLVLQPNLSFVEAVSYIKLFLHGKKSI